MARIRFLNEDGTLPSPAMAQIDARVGQAIDHVNQVSGLTGEDQAVASLIGDPNSATHRSAATQFRDTYQTIEALMATAAPTGAIVRTSGHQYENDGIEVTYRISDALTQDRVLSLCAVPLTDGRWALPLNLPMLPAATLDYYAGLELLSVARTYVDAGAQLVYDSTRLTPLNAPQPVHQMTTAPYPVTCSSFVELALSAWRFGNTTYTAPNTTNTASHAWGITWPTKAFIPGPWQAHSLLGYMFQQGFVHYYRADKTPLARGDILFFSRQDPEGPGTGGRYFMNAYHVALYVGGDSVIHAYSPLSGPGVVEQPLSQGLKDNLTFVARPPLQSGSLHSVSPSSLPINATSLSGSAQLWYDRQVAHINCDYITATAAIGAGSFRVLSTLPHSPLAPYTAMLSTNQGTAVRLVFNPGERPLMHLPQGLASGEVIYGTASVPVRAA